MKDSQLTDEIIDDTGDIAETDPAALEDEQADGALTASDRVS